jgi:enediyne biosynthesis protein E4
MTRRICVALLSLATVTSPAGEPRLEDVTREAGIAFRHQSGATGRFHYPEIMGVGVILFDEDGDGDMDLYFLNGNYLGERPPDPTITNALYRNDSANGTLRFTDVTVEAGVGDPGYGQGGEAADFDGDGDEDLFVTNLGRDVLFRNDGNGRFRRSPLPDRKGWGQTCAALDYDRDGDLDLFVANYLTYDPSTERPATTRLGNGKEVPDYQAPQAFRGMSSLLLRNEGNLVFTDVTRQVGLYRPDGKGMGLACVDFDGDGWIDIYQTNDTVENFLFMNRKGKFEEMALMAGCAAGLDGFLASSMGADIADIDGDGRPDILVPNLVGQVHRLYLNRWPWFQESSVEWGLHVATRDRTGFSPSFLDYDNDGDQDLFISCGRVSVNEKSREDSTFLDRYGETALLLENDGRGRFRSVGASSGPYFAEVHVGRGTAVADLDGDGRPDIVVNHDGEEPAVLINRTPGGHWLTLQLVGRGMNRDAIGAHVVARVGSATRHHWVRGGGSYLSVSDRRVHLGLGAATTVDRIEITWPLGKRTLLENVPGDRFLTVEEPER